MSQNKALSQYNTKQMATAGKTHAETNNNKQHFSES